jgi:general secretion pathway protein K
MVELCDCLETGVNPATVLRAVRDWMTQKQAGSDSDAAKDSYYLSLQPPYRAGLRKFAHASELLAIQGVTPKLYRFLRPFVTALPDKDVTAINVNTAPREVLRAACDSIDEGKLAQWVKRVQQDKQPVVNGGNGIEEFFTFTGCGFNTAVSNKNKLFSAITTYFQIRGDVFVGSGRLALYSLVSRPMGGVPKVVARDVD